MDSFTQRVAAEVRAEMARQNYSQQTLANALGMAQGTLSRRLSGRLPFNTNELFNAAEALGCPVTRFVIVSEDVPS